MAHICERTLPHIIMSAHCRTQSSEPLPSKPNLIHSFHLWAHNAVHICERILPHTIVSAHCRTQLSAPNEANLYNFSLSFVTPRAANIYLQHVQCDWVISDKWLIPFHTIQVLLAGTRQRLVLQQHQLRFTAEVSLFWFSSISFVLAKHIWWDSTHC